MNKSVVWNTTEKPEMGPPKCGKIDKLDPTKKLLLCKIPCEEDERQHNCRKYLQTIVCNDGLIPRIYYKLSNYNLKNDIQLKNWPEGMKRKYTNIK